jgi:hypothetical protein
MCLDTTSRSTTHGRWMVRPMPRNGHLWGGSGGHIVPDQTRNARRLGAWKEVGMKPWHVFDFD